MIMRLISICPSNTELVAYLGLTNQLVGVDDFSDWPTSVQDFETRTRLIYRHECTRVLKARSCARIT